MTSATLDTPDIAQKNLKKPDLSKTSYSRLGVYRKCPEQYRLHYVEGSEGSGKVLQESLLKGSLAHYCIEEHLAGGHQQKDGIADLVIANWLAEDCGLQIADTDADVGINPDLLHRYAHETALLLHRCSPNYLGDDKIRKRDGSCLISPLEYPSREFSDRYNAAGLPSIAQYIDMEATQLNPAFSRFSLAHMTAKAVCYFYNFFPPSWFGSTVAVEHDVANHPIALDESRSWIGKIDWIYKTTEGAVVIADHKSGKECPSSLDVLNNAQLNCYAGIYYEQTGVMADFISISYLPTGDHILAKTDIRIVAKVLQHLREIQARIDIDMVQDGWLKALPSDYNTPCWRRNWKTKALEDVCPYIKTCWPDYANLIEQELTPIFT